MAGRSIHIPAEIAIKVAIGEVCLQWARLEMALLGLIVQIEPMEMEHCFIKFGGLDIIPRVNMTLKLAYYHKVPMPYTKRIVAVRKALQDGLCDRRNQVVHGAQKDEDGAAATFTMVRWNGDERHKQLDAKQVSDLAGEIHELGTEVWSIQTEMLDRALQHHLGEDYLDDLGKT